jgi:hypothetical protein
MSTCPRPAAISARSSAGSAAPTPKKLIRSKYLSSHGVPGSNESA